MGTTTRLVLIGCCASLAACVDININNYESSESGSTGDPVTAIGPDHNDSVQLADAEIWIVPPLNIDDSGAPQEVTWALLHPDAPTMVTIQRTCTLTPEAFLWLSDPPDWNGALATFHGCGTPGEFYASVQLAYDGEKWIGVSATGAATLLPPE